MVLQHAGSVLMLWLIDCNPRESSNIALSSEHLKSRAREVALLP